MMIPAIILFALTYVLILVFSKYRPYIALASGVLFVVTGMLPLGDVFGSIDFNVLLMIAGTMGIVALFIESKMPSLLADLVMEKVPTVQIAAVAMALFAGIISAFVDNVATVLMVAPVALEICKKLKTNPVPFIIGIAVSSNLQGAATLVGDTTAIMLGSALDMSFLDFIIYNGKPGIFFAVELGAVLSALILAVLFRKEKKPIPKTGERTKVTDYVPTVLLVGVIVALIGASFIPNKPDITNGLICCVLMVIGLVYNFIRKKNISAIIEPVKQIDFETIGLLLGLFLMIGGISAQGVIDAAANLLAKAGGGNIFFLYTVVTWASVLISAFIDNIPYVATMIPVIGGLATALDIDPTVLYFGLLSGATLGGNCTPIGASANITGIGILRKEGYEVKNSDFFKIGIPFTLAAIIPAYIFLWIFYGV
ncbi:MAG: TRAP transporter large permease subunit [Clostridia bacterium]|nr:TRAP transporter large permease subunit [Clostridia bacterium]